MVFPPSGICEEMILAHFGYTMYCLGPLVIKCTVYAIWLYNVLFKPFGYTMYCLGPLVYFLPKTFKIFGFPIFGYDGIMSVPNGFIANITKNEHI